jgi:GR25 family glycosyltransferase involved in LPS biosynthesis
MKFIIYILSIKNCERRVHVEQLTNKLLEKGFFVEIVDAIYWKECDVLHILKEMKIELGNSNISQSQIACFLTHRKAWEIITGKDSDDIHIIIEDDVDISDDCCVNTLEKVYESIEQKDYDSIFLYKHPEQVNPNNETYNDYLLKYYFQWGFVAYSISTEFAKELYDSIRYIDLPVDDQIHNRIFQKKKERIFFTIKDYFKNIGFLGGYKCYGDYIFKSTIWQ